MILTRIVFGLAFSVATSLGMSHAGAAQSTQVRNYPSKPIRIIVPFGPGGGSDTLTRIIAEKLVESWGQPVVTDNRPGAGGVIASDLAAKSAPDGYTLLMGMVSTHAMIPNLLQHLPYDPIKDFSPVGLAVISPNILVVHPSVPANTVLDLIALAKSRPGKLIYASAGNGTPAHLAAELFSSMAGIKMIHVPYRGGALGLNDLIGGQVSLMFAGPIESLPQIRAGKVRALAVTTPHRFSTAPDLPTIAEAGLPGYEVIQWNGLFAPARTVREIVNGLNTEVNRILGLSDVKERLLRQGFEPSPGSPEEFGKFVSSEIAKWGRVIQKAGIRLE